MYAAGAAAGSTGPLAGVRVIDLTSVVLGPLATQTLGDYGADVIKVESPDGDIMRHAEPARSPGMGAVFLNANRNKRSVVLDLKTPGGRSALQRLIAGADVFVHSMRPQAIARLGFDDAALRAIQPDIISCATWGFRADGPYGGRPAYDDVIQGMSGLADLFRRRSGGAPEFAPSIMADKITGLTAFGAIAAALFHRARSGEGQAIEVPMFETLVAFNLVEHFAGHTFEPPVGDIGYTRALSPERRPYQTADGFIAVLPYATRHWVRFADVIGRPDLSDDPRVTDPATRSRHIEELYRIVADVMPARTTDDWLARISEADVPCVRVNTLEEVASDPHLAAIDFFEPLNHPSEGAIRTTAVPVVFSRTPGSATQRPAPRLGADTRDVLEEAGMSPAAVDDLIASGAAQLAAPDTASDPHVTTT